MTVGLIQYFATTFLRTVAEHHYDIKEAVIKFKTFFETRSVDENVFKTWECSKRNFICIDKASLKVVACGTLDQVK
jgi:hypothetical protein